VYGHAEDKDRDKEKQEEEGEEEKENDGEDDDGREVGFYPDLTYSLDKKRRWELVPRKIACERLRAKIAAESRDRLAQQCVDQADGGCGMDRSLPTLQRLCILAIRSAMTRDGDDVVVPESLDPAFAANARRLALAAQRDEGGLPWCLRDQALLGENEAAWAWHNRCGVRDESELYVYRNKRIVHPQKEFGATKPRNAFIPNRPAHFEVGLAADLGRWPFLHQDTCCLPCCVRETDRARPFSRRTKRARRQFSDAISCGLVEVGAGSPWRPKKKNGANIRAAD